MRSSKRVVWVILVGFLILSDAYVAEARRGGGFLFFSWGGEKIIKLVDFPDTDVFQTTDGRYFDAGAIYSQFSVMFVPIWNYNVRWTGYISEYLYAEVNKEDLIRFARVAQVSLPPEVKLPFWDSYGGKLLLVCICGVFVLWVWSDAGEKEEESVANV